MSMFMLSLYRCGYRSDILIRVLDQNLKLQCLVRETLSAERVERLNDENTLTFEAIVDDQLEQYLTEDSILELDGDYFDIARYKKEVSTDVTVRIEAEHVSYRLNDPDLDKKIFVETGRPTSMLGYILSGTGLNVGYVGMNNLSTYTVKEPTSRRKLLTKYADTIGGELTFYKFDVGMVEKRGSRSLKLFTSGKNVRIIDRTVDKKEGENGVPLRAYNIETLELENGTMSVGDDVKLVQSELNLSENLRVVGYSYDPYLEFSTNLVIANFEKGIEDDIYQTEEALVAKGNVYNGCRISPQEGFVAEGIVEGTDQVISRTIMNATEGISIYSGELELERNFFVDMDGRIKAKGLDIFGESTFNGDIFASKIYGSEIDVDTEVTVGNYLHVGGPDVVPKKGIDITYGGQTASIEVDPAGELTIWSWADAHIVCPNRLVLSARYLSFGGSDLDINTNYLDVIANYVTLPTNSYITDARDHLPKNLIATMGDIDNLATTMNANQTRSQNNASEISRLWTKVNSMSTT